jgi:hypothetical protein
MNTEKIIFILVLLGTVVIAILPMFGVDIANPDCSLMNTCTRFVKVQSELQVGGYPATTWVINNLQATVGGAPNPPALSLWFPSGDIKVNYNLYKKGTDVKIKPTGEVFNPETMDLTGIDPNYARWNIDDPVQPTWMFSGVPNGEYEVGAQFFEKQNNVWVAITGIARVVVVVQ